MQANNRKIDELAKDTTSSHSSNSITGFKENKNNLLRITGIVTSTLVNLLIILTIILYFAIGSTRNNQILIFEYTNGYTPFQTHQAVLIIYLFLLFAFYLVITYLLLTQKDKEFIKIYQTRKFSSLFSLINIFLVSVLLIGLILTKTLVTSILILALLSASTIGVVVLYRKIKIKKRLSPFSLFGCSIFLSVLLAFNTYLILYDLCDLITFNNGDSYVANEFKQFFAIFINVIYMCIAIVLLSLHKDIIFSICLVLIEIGYIANSYHWVHSEIVTGVIIITFVVLSIIITVLKYKKAVFGFEDNEVCIKDFENEWIENSSNCNNYDS